MIEEDQRQVSIDNDINAKDDELSSYKDENIEVSSNGLTIKNYYFPTLSSKVIPIDKIKNVDLFELDWLNGKNKLWGLSLNFYYYNLDKSRSNKTHGITIKEEGDLIGTQITPDDPKKCLKVLKNLMSHQKDNKKSDPLLKEGEKESLKNGKEKRN
jgi:hypothetical protein